MLLYDLMFFSGDPSQTVSLSILQQGVQLKAPPESSRERGSPGTEAVHLSSVFQLLQPACQLV